jgi:hypothetical protein
MPSVFETLIGQRVKSKLSEYAYANNFTGSHESLMESINNLESVVRIVTNSVADVIQAEVEVLASRDPLGASKNQTLFMAGLLHARDMIQLDKSLIGKSDLE